MATSRTAKKRNRQNLKWRTIHKAHRTEIRTLVKKEQSLIEETKDAAKAQETLLALQQKLDKAAGAHTMHKNTVARKKSRLTRKVNKLAKGDKK